MKKTTRMLVTVLALTAITMTMGACRGPYEPDYAEREEAVMQNQPFTPHSIGR